MARLQRLGKLVVRRNQTMKNKMMTLMMIAAALMTSNLYAASSETGTLRVVVMDVNGKPTDAPVYIYGAKKAQFMGAQQVNGAMTFNMPEGTYRVSSAITQKNGDYMDRFASNEATVRVVPGDNASVILSLKQIEDPTPGITYTALRRMGLPTDVNN